ncbi:hypothetical protein Tco_1007611 [Tanacetum coccineum]
MATSTLEAEYVAAANCCGQVLWIQNQMLDYGFNFMNTKIYIDNESTICIVKNPVFHSKTKHIEIRHHFIRDAYEKKLIQVLKIHSDDNMADLLTKAFDGRQNGRVLALETSKDAQATEILKLKTRIKKLEKKCRPSISHHRAWLRSVSRLSRKKKLGKKESVFKQGRKNAQPGPTLDAFDDLDIDLAHGMDYMETEEAVKEGRQSNETEELNLDADTEVIAKDKGSGEKGVSTVSTARPDIDTARPEVNFANAPVSTAGVTISTADPEVSAVEPRTPPTTTSIFDDEDITMAQTLIKMKKEKSKEKGVAFKDVEDSSRPMRSITTLKPLPSIDPKYKGKGILVEEELVKIKRKYQGIDQIERDEELSHKLHEEELAEIARIQEEKVAQEEAFRTAIMEMIDEVQACIDVDALAAQKAAEIRSRPPTKAQLRHLMMTYLKNMGGYKHSQLKAKTFEEIQGMYKRQKKKINDFKPIDSDDAVKDSKKAAGEDTSKKEEVLKEPDSTKVGVKLEEAEQGTKKTPEDERKIESINKEDAGESREKVSDVSKKRKGGPRMKRMSKRKKTESDLEEEEDLKTFLKIVPDKEGIIDYKRFETITPEGVDLVLWGDLRTMFDANVEDETTEQNQKDGS